MEWIDRIGRRIKLRDFRVLIALAESETMVKAAGRLGTSHPVISKTISDLEKSLGVRLLERSVHGVELTVPGRALLRCGVAVFDELRQGLEQIESLSDPDAGELRIGCPEVISAGLLPTVAERFAERFPRARLEVVFAATPRSQFDELRNRNVELLLGPIPSPFPDIDLHVEHLFMEQFVVVAGKDSPLSHKRRLQLKDLQGQRWVLPPPDSLPGELVAAIFKANNMPVPQAPMVNLSIHLTAALVATSKFVALLPGSIVRFNAKRLGLKVLPIRLPPQRRPIGLVTLKKRNLSQLAARLIACVREVTRAIT